MQDLVRVCVADAAEEMRIGQRALQRMAFLSKGRGKRVDAARHRLEPAGVERCKRIFAPTTWSDARFFVAASVRRSVPPAKSNAASPTFVEPRRPDLAT